MKGWIKTYRKLLEWEWHTDPNMVSLWLHLLLMANRKDGRWRGLEVKRGQLITGRKALSEATGISEQSIRTCLERLKATNEITIKTTNKFSIITICEFDSYQDAEYQNDQQINQQTNQQLTNNQPTTNHKQEDREGDKDNLSDNKLSILREVAKFFNEQVELNNSIMPKVKSVSGKRAGNINARLREHGLDAVKEMITIAVKSDFLNGKNKRGWSANFDWLFLPTNFQKVLEGNYNGRENEKNTGAASDPLSRARIHTAHIG